MRLRARSSPLPLAGTALVPAVALGACAPAAAGPDEEGAGSWSQRHSRLPDGSDSWCKGNTHTPTTESDGDSSPETVARWYQEHGHDWPVLSDHKVFTDPANMDAIRQVQGVPHTNHPNFQGEFGPDRGSPGRAGSRCGPEPWMPAP